MRGGWRALLGLALALYLAGALYQLDLPGVNYDEALDAVPAMQVVSGQEVECYATFRLGGRTWPLMVIPYVGATTTYWLIPPFALFGSSVAVMRGANIALGVLTLLTAWGFLREYLDERAAGLSVLLLAANPSFVFWTRIGAYISLPSVPLAIGLLWSLLRWAQRDQGRYLLLAGASLGLGLSTHVLSVWMAVAVGLAWLIWSPAFAPGEGWRAWGWPLRRARWWVWLGAALAALAGAWMLLLYNLQGWGTLRLFLRNLHRTELYGVNNFDVLTNLGTVFGHDLRQFLDGSWFANVLGEAGHNPLAVPALVVAVALLLWLGIRRQLPYPPRRLALLGLFLVTIVAQSAFTPTSLGANHLVIAWPIPQALLATALIALGEALERARRGVGGAVAGALLLLLLAGDARMTWAYHRVTAQTGGVGHSSDAIYALARDVQAPDALKPVLLDWGWGRSLRLLTGGRVAMDERYDYSHRPGDDFRGWINRRVVAGPGLYLLHPPQYTAFAGHAELFEEAAYRHRLAPVLAKTYTQRDGVPACLAYRLEPVPRRYAAPPIPRPLSARLGTQLALLGHDLPATPQQSGATLTVTLYWQALERPTRSIKVFAHLVDGSGRLATQYDGVPMLWGYPTTEWEPGEVIEDRVKLHLAGLVPGEYTLLIGMYDRASGDRLPLHMGGERQPHDALPLGPVTVE